MLFSSLLNISVLLCFNAALGAAKPEINFNLLVARDGAYQLSFKAAHDDKVDGLSTNAQKQQVACSSKLHITFRKIYIEFLKSWLKCHLLRKLCVLWSLELYAIGCRMLFNRSMVS
jgi:hypothetical protein